GIDGNIGALLERCRSLLLPGGTIIVEIDPRPDWHQTRRVRLTAQTSGFSAQLIWTRTGAATVRRQARPLDLLVDEEWSAGGRAFLSLKSPTCTRVGGAAACEGARG